MKYLKVIFFLLVFSPSAFSQIGAYWVKSVNTRAYDATLKAWGNWRIDENGHTVEELDYSKFYGGQRQVFTLEYSNSAIQIDRFVNFPTGWAYNTVIDLKGEPYYDGHSGYEQLCNVRRTFYNGDNDLVRESEFSAKIFTSGKPPLTVLDEPSRYRTVKLTLLADTFVEVYELMSGSYIQAKIDSETYKDNQRIKKEQQAKTYQELGKSIGTLMQQRKRN